MGVSTNFNRLCACVLDDLVDPSLYLARYPQAIRPRLHEFDLAGIQALYAAVDIIGARAGPC